MCFQFQEDGGDAELSLLLCECWNGCWARGRKVLVSAFTIRRRDCVETQFPWNSPTPLRSSPPSSSSKLRLDWCRCAKYTRGGKGREAVFVFGQNTPRGGTEGEKKRVILEGARVVRCSYVFPPPPRFGLQPRRSEWGTMELVSVSLSLSLFLPPLSDRRETNGVSRAVAANSRHSPNYKQYAARCVWRPTDK